MDPNRSSFWIRTDPSIQPSWWSFSQTSRTRGAARATPAGASGLKHYSPKRPPEDQRPDTNIWIRALVTTAFIL